MTTWRYIVHSHFRERIIVTFKSIDVVETDREKEKKHDRFNWRCVFTINIVSRYGLERSNYLLTFWCVMHFDWLLPILTVQERTTTLDNPFPTDLYLDQLPTGRVRIIAQTNNQWEMSNFPDSTRQKKKSSNLFTSMVLLRFTIS